MTSPIREVQPMPSPSTQAEKGEEILPEKVTPEPESVEVEEHEPESPSPVKPSPDENGGGLCPKCGTKLKSHDTENLICVKCGILFDRKRLAKIWSQVDQYNREFKAGHRVGEN